ncbi:hypothetical protein [Ornithinibacillus halophilus]|uniref:Sulfurtransferase n=1 Tax=Ornithinibacillus halophilus TaxID=930117 RepID=A0A1M5F4U9_9BACI|nr:hypothetical protein [Ornithinibacillus halophilus]SHF86630.1 hypothetical protein SAMN05216225_100758 [Ornithinibacillus halophilus]
MEFIYIVLCIALLSFLYKRHMPVFGVKNIKSNDFISIDDKVILDIRAYNTSCNGTFEVAHCLPISYLNRYYKEIPNKPILLVASDHVEKNLAARFLKSRGYSVIGYYIASEDEQGIFCYNF